MAESLLSILLISGSAKGPVLVYRWPPLRFCSPRPRLSRARLDGGPWPSRIDNPWRASHTPEALEEQAESMDQSFDADDSEYRWQRPATAVCPKSPSVSGSVSPRSPLEQPFSLPSPEPIGRHEYDHLFGYHVDFLANLLLPHQSMCHQKFELLVDGLAFIGHPVHVDAEGKWRFKTDKGGSHTRAKETTTTTATTMNETQTSTQDDSETSSVTQRTGGWLQSFHLVFVCDRPDPSSSASGNLFKYYEIIYEQAAFPITAVLFQEQVMNNFVEEECDKLGSIKDLAQSEGLLRFFTTPFQCTS